MKKAVALGAVLLPGCAVTGTNGVVSMGPNIYMVGGLGGGFEFSGTALKEKYYQQAEAFCKQKGLLALPVKEKSQDAKPGEFSSAEIQFKCVAQDAQ